MSVFQSLWPIRSSFLKDAYFNMPKLNVCTKFQVFTHFRLGCGLDTNGWINTIPANANGWRKEPPIIALSPAETSKLRLTHCIDTNSKRTSQDTK